MAIEVLACLFVVGLLFLHWWNLSEHLVDVPRGDDWRMLRPGRQVVRSEFDRSWLFIPANSTVSATGKLLDYLFLVRGPGNYLLYKQISLVTVLGGCVLLVSRLLQRLVLPLPWHLLGILSTAYLLQARSYWGGFPALAYHQALPVVGILAILVLVTSRRWGMARAGLLAAIVVASGFAYISGAVAMTALGISLLVIAIGYRRAAVDAPEFANLLTKSWVVLAAGVFTLAVQLEIVLGPAGLLPANPPLATPLDWQFWAFSASQLPRALGDLQSSSAAVTRAVLSNISVFAVVIAALVQCALRIAKGSGRPRDLHYLVIATGILMPLLGYLAVVSAGRANFHRPETVLELVWMAKSRFHYWWLVPLLTVFAVSSSFIASSRDEAHREPARYAAARSWLLALLIAGIALGLQTQNPWNFDAAYRPLGRYQMAGLRCLERGYREEGPIYCPKLTGRYFKINLRPPVRTATDLGLPFALALATGKSASNRR